MLPQSSKLGILSLIALSFGCLATNAQVTGLNFRPVSAQYSLPLDRIIMISGGPNQLHIYDPVAHADTTVALGEVPLSLSLTPDGTHAAVVFADAASYIDLSAASVVRTFSNLSFADSSSGTTPVAVAGSNYTYIFPSYSGDVFSLNIASGTVSHTSGVYAEGGVFDPAQNAVYSISFSQVHRFDASAGPITTFQPVAAPYFTSPNTCSPLALSGDGTTIYSGCGAAFTASSDTSKDMRYKGLLPGVSQSQSLAVSDLLHQVAVVPLVSSTTFPATPLADTVINLFNSITFTSTGQFATTPFVVNGVSFAAHGRWAFYNSTGSSLFVVTQADSTAALESDYALESIDLSTPNSCSATFAASSSAALAAGGYATAQIQAGEHCLFTAVSNSPWIALSLGYYGSGNTTLSYLVRPNLTSSTRTGTMSLGSQTLTVTQAAAGAAADLNPLSFKPVAADYDKALDKVVLVSAAPNELHLYDPLTQNDQIILLPSTPLSVSVSPDGLFAVVGHNTGISYIDLTALTVSKVIALDLPASGVLLAGNGYAYVFSTLQDNSNSNGYSVEISSRALTRTPGFVNAAHIPRLYETGAYIYLTGGGASKFDVSAGPAVLLASNVYPFAGGTNYWLSEDGVRMVTSNGTAYFTSVNPSQDFGADGVLSGATSVAWAANSQIQHQTAILLGDGPFGTSAVNTQLQIYSDNGLALQTQLAMPQFSAAGTNYPGHGRYVFWNAAATKLFAFMEADSTSGLLSDYAEYTVEAPASLPPCSYAVSPSVMNIAPTYSSATLGVTSNCNWNVVIPTGSWLSAYNTSGIAGTNQQVSLSAQSNTGAARSVSITVGNQTVVVNQADSTCAYTFSANSFAFTQYGGTGSVNLTTGNNCAWSAQSNAPWLTIPAASQSGTGSATIQFIAASNPTPTSSQYGVLSVAGITALSVTENYSAVSPALNFVPVTPCRVTDTRTPSGAPYISANTTKTVNIPGSSCNVPASAAAYSLNVTVVPHQGLSYLTVFPAGLQQPNVSTLNSDGRVKANAAIVPAGTNGGVSFYSTDDTELVLDIDGYFVPATANTGLEFYPLTPCRISDTRNANGPLGGPVLAAAQSRDFPILQSSCNVPSTAQAYSLNFTAVPPTGDGIGYLSAWPAGQAQPLVSTLNASATVTANAAIVPAGTNGSFSVYTSDKTDLVVDINAYFAPPATSGLHFYSVPPCRVFDSRFAATGLPTAPPFAGAINVYVAPYCDVPLNASAVVVNATVVPQQSLGFLSLWPAGSTQPLVSTLNADDLAVTSNMAILPMGASGQVSAYASGQTHLILDINGYFAP